MAGSACRLIGLQCGRGWQGALRLAAVQQDWPCQRLGPHSDSCHTRFNPLKISSQPKPKHRQLCPTAHLVSTLMRLAWYGRTYLISVAENLESIFQ